MPDRNPSIPQARIQLAAIQLGRIAVIDVGSNSLRLVVFERLGATLLPLLNEKVMCGLGRGIASSGRLNPDGVALAVPNLQRFVALARALSVDHLAIIATSAVRDAVDGRAFAAEIERRCGVPVRIVPGTEEARLSAIGVLAGIPDADGMVADLGGGSIELVPVCASAAGTVGGGAGRAIGDGLSLPLGALRLAELGENRKKIADTIDRSIAGARIAGAAAGKSLYLVGGAWRAIARLHMEQARYPLHIIHYYTLDRRAADIFLDIVSNLSRRSLERITTISRKRLELVPLAAQILRKLVAAAAPDRIVFSAYGLREGYAHSVLADVPPRDPLIAACIAMADTQSRWRADGDRLQQWTAPVFPDLGPAQRRLHSAACWLSDIGWTEHPDYRAEQAFTRVLRMPVGAISHPERGFIASVLHARYGGPEDPVKLGLGPILDEPSVAAARALGLALRLAYTLCGGALNLLLQTALSREDGALILELPAEDTLFSGESVQRRLDALGRALGLPTRIRRRAPVRISA